MPELSSVYSVENDANTMPEITPYIRHNTRETKETFNSQKLLLRKWNKERKTLHRELQLAPELRNQIQLEQVCAIVEYAFRTNSFYHELYSDAGYEIGAINSWSDFEKLPIVSKRMMIDSGYSDLCATKNGQNVPLHSARTSGSSGINLTIYQDDASVNYRHIRYMRHCELLMRRPLKEKDIRYGIYFVAERYTSLLGGYRFVTVSQETPPQLLASHIADVRPSLILSFPSSLHRLAATGIRLDEFGVLAVGTNSERSSLEERINLAKKLGVPVLDEYSSEEMSLIAYECYEHKYHLVEDSGYFETIDTDEQGYGHLVGTSLGNRAMPFIRYDQGDILKIDSEASCPCGSAFRIIDSFQGREDVVLQDGTGHVISADAILGLCDDTLVHRNSNIQEYQIVQTSYNNIELRVIAIDRNKGLDNHYILEFVRRLPSLFLYVNVNVSVKEVSTLDGFPSGKRRLIENKIQKGLTS